MPETKDAIISHPVLSCPPQLSGGRIMPVVVQAFENHVENYFLNAKDHPIPKADKVTHLLGSFEGPLVNQWISQNQTRLCALTFPQFLAEFRQCWLPNKWEQELLTQILQARLEPQKSSFEDWSTEIQTINNALTRTTAFLTEDQMCQQLESNIDKDLRLLVRKADAADITGFVAWLRKVSK